MPIEVTTGTWSSECRRRRADQGRLLEKLETSSDLILLTSTGPPFRAAFRQAENYVRWPFSIFNKR